MHLIKTEIELSLKLATGPAFPGDVIITLNEPQVYMILYL